MERVRMLGLLDVLVVVLLAGSGIAGVWRAPPTSLAGGAWVHSVLVVGFTVPLLARRRHPAVVLLVVSAATWLQFELGGGLGQPFFAVLIALYAVGAYADRLASLLAPAVVVAQIVSVDLARLRSGDPIDEVVPAWFVLIGSWLFGCWMRRRRRVVTALALRVEQVERDAEALAEAAVSEERARIARELHDLVAHSMGVIVIQAQAGQRRLTTDLDSVSQTLATIETIGRDGLAEMRRLLGLLTATEAGSTAPQPSLAQLPELVSTVRAAGLPVHLRIEGEPRNLAPGVELAAYRIVQEALTNTLKHAGQTEAAVALRYRGGSVEVEVTDTGSGGTGQIGGHGLVGMRERVELYGGSIETGPRASGGFRVRALIPGGRE